MAIKPPGSYIAITKSGVCATVYVTDIRISYVTEPFDRLEFSNPKLRSAPTSTGALPQLTRNIANGPIQLLTTCTGDSARPLQPDDANIDSIKKRFNIIRWQIEGAVSVNSAIDQVQVWAAEHKRLKSVFDLHGEKQQLELSYGALVNLQSQTFSYLTTTGVHVHGNGLISSDFPVGYVSDILMMEFEQGIEYEVMTSNGLALYKTFTMIFDKRSIANRSAT